MFTLNVANGKPVVTNCANKRAIPRRATQPSPPPIKTNENNLNIFDLFTLYKGKNFIGLIQTNWLEELSLQANF